MSKGEMTRQAILQEALSMASERGLEGLSLAPLAAKLHMSKSGLFSHFQSKETLQLHVIDYAAYRFIENVIRPAISEPEGEERIRSMFEHWLEWPKADPLPGGCFFVAAATELDDRPGLLRDRLVQLQRRWLGVLAEMARMAAAEGHFRPDIDAEQFAHDIYGVMLAYHHASRLLRDPKAKGRVRTAFQALIQDARNPVEAGPGKKQKVNQEGKRAGAQGNSASSEPLPSSPLENRNSGGVGEVSGKDR